jgi:O-antigen ligase
MKPIKTRIENYLVLTLVSTTLIITPNVGFDSFNVPKLLILVIGSITTFTLIISARLLLKEYLFQPYSIIFLVFLFCLTSVLIFSGAPLLNQIFGTFGRSSGYLAYLMLILLVFVIVVLWSEKFEVKFIYGLLTAGTVNLIYAIFQSFRLDLFKWGNVASPIFGTFGNANFLSAFLGITSIVALALLLDSKNKNHLLSFFLVCKIILSQSVILLSTSNQGILIFLISSAVIIYYRYIRVLPKVLFRIIFIGIFSLGFLIGLMGILNFGPLASLLFQQSTQLRGDYWRAGWRMGLDNPFFGVGLDNYGSWWLKYRDQAAILRAPDVTSNAAHNVFIDMLANGGIPLFLIHIILFMLITKYAIANVRATSHYQALNIATFAAWLAFGIQSIVSIFQLGLTSWGWAFMGLIIGRYLKMKNITKAESNVGKNSQSPNKRNKSEDNYVFVGIPAIAFAIAISIWPIRQDFLFKSAIQSNQIMSINKSIYTFPRNDFYAVVVAETYLNSKLYDESLKATKLALNSNPNNYLALELLVKNPISTITSIEVSKSKMRLLNPYKS